MACARLTGSTRLTTTRDAVWIAVKNKIAWGATVPAQSCSTTLTLSGLALLKVSRALSLHRFKSLVEARDSVSPLRLLDALLLPHSTCEGPASTAENLCQAKSKRSLPSVRRGLIRTNHCAMVFTQTSPDVRTSFCQCPKCFFDLCYQPAVYPRGDGSIKNNLDGTDAAGWKIVAVSPANTFQIFCGSVICDSRHPAFLGVTTCSNNTSELTGLAEAIWCANFVMCEYYTTPSTLHVLPLMMLTPERT